MVALIAVDHDPFADAGADDGAPRYASLPEPPEPVYLNDAGQPFHLSGAPVSGDALARAMTGVAPPPEAGGFGAFARAGLRHYADLLGGDYSNQPLLGLDRSTGELTGRIPAIADIVAGGLAGPVPGGALGAGPAILGRGARGSRAALTQAAEPAAVLPAAQEGIKAWHGSPYDFSEFDPAKIGSGEGAQAYGHGLYFAENPKTAQSYKFAGQPGYLNQNVQRIAQEAYAAAEKEVPEGGDLIAATRDRLWTQYKQATDPAQRIPIQDAYNNITALVGPNTKIGKMYEVNLHADPEAMLDWDKPLAQQSEQVQEFFKQMGLLVAPNKIETRKLDLLDKSGAWRGYMQPGESPETLKGERLYGLTSSEDLQKAGIPGIRYLDQFSRGEYSLIGKNQEWGILQPNGNEFPFSFADKAKVQAMVDQYNRDMPSSHNYVMFDPRMIEIIKKYGLAALVAGGATTLAGSGGAYAHVGLPVDHDPFAGQ